MTECRRSRSGRKFTKANDQGMKSQPHVSHSHIAAGHVLSVRQDKAPLTPHGVHDATTEPEIMERWYRCYPAGGVGHGTCEQLVALDLGSQEAITEALAQREHEDSDTAANFTVNVDCPPILQGTRN
jgi:hypothetical protein